MDTGKAEAIAAGRIAKTFGLNGELVISLYDTFPTETNGEPVYIEIDGIWTPFFFASFRRRGQSKAVAVFEDIDTEYRASELTSKEFYLFVEPEIDDGDKIYLQDLVDYAVQLEGQEGNGTLTGFIENELNPLFEIEWNGKEILVPAADDFIVRIDQPKKAITLAIPEGLLDL